MKRSSREKSKWYFVDGRKSILTARISGLNLQGTGKTTGFFFAKELKTTVFMVQLQVYAFRWQVSRTFEEFREFYLFLPRDEALGPNRNSLAAPFPQGADGECDTMVLLERREMVEEFIQEVVAKIDYELYEPLNNFISAKENLKPLFQKLALIVSTIRKHIAKKKLNMRLFRFYSKELLKFVYTMESGIEVFDATCTMSKPTPVTDRDTFSGVNPMAAAASAVASPEKSGGGGMPMEYVLWLDVCEEMALSRLCLAPKEVFELPAADYEDERLANGIFLSDIAEVRRGTASHGFKMSKATWIKPAMCVSIVGSERTLDIQFTSEEEISRFLFIDMLNLLTLQSLHSNEIKLRHKRYRKVNTNMHLKVFQHKLSPQDIKNGNKMADLLESGIDVDVETYSPYYGINIRQKLLKYNKAERKLYISDRQAPGTENEYPDDEPPFDDFGGEGAAAEQMGATEEDRGAGGGAYDEYGSSYDNDSSVLSYASSGGVNDAPPQDTIGGNSSGSNSNSGLLHGNDLTTQNRGIDIDDISEIRPGKISFCADGGEDLLVLSIIASETVVCLPVSTIKLRNNLINRFHAFIQLNRDFEALDTDAPRVFRRKSMVTPRKNVLGGVGQGSTTPINKIVAGLSKINTTSPMPNAGNGSGKHRYQDTTTTPRANHVGATNGGNSSSSTGRSSHSRRHSNTAKNKKDQIYSHLMQVRSVSMVRSSTMSSRNSSSITEFLSKSIDSL